MKALSIGLIKGNFHLVRVRHHTIVMLQSVQCIIHYEQYLLLVAWFIIHMFLSSHLTRINKRSEQNSSNFLGTASSSRQKTGTLLSTL